MKKVLIGIITIGIIFGAIFLFGKEEEKDKSTGSVGIAGEYHSTTTAANAIYGVTLTGDGQIKIGQGTFGSVVITGADTGAFNFYNATTTDITQRESTKATTTILIASIPASAAAGTYTFDTVFSDGLLLDLVSGNIPTTTITYR